MKCLLLSSGQEIKYSDLVILKTCIIFKTSQRYPSEFKKKMIPFQV